MEKRTMDLLKGIMNLVGYVQVTYFPITRSQRSVSAWRSTLRLMGVKTRWSIRPYRIGDTYRG